MRIISGTFRSRRLKGTPPPGIRPTSDKLRETLFNVLGENVRGSVFLDACAGMGAIGIEAVSRGARMVFFVDRSRKATAIIRENLESLGVTEGVRVLQMEVSKALEICHTQGVVFDIVFLDPPYEEEGLYTETLELLPARSLLAQDGIVIMEHSRRLELPETAGGLRRVRVLSQGDSSLSFYRNL